MPEFATRQDSVPGQGTISATLTAAKNASRSLGRATTGQKDRALEAIASILTESSSAIADANRIDLDRGRANGLADGLLDRLKLDRPRIEGLAASVREIIALSDPVGQSVRGHTLPNGVQVAQVRVPFGVIGAIYEARPNVTVDISALAVKSGNALVLRGGSAAQSTNATLVELIREAIASVGIAPDAVSTIDEFGRAGAQELMAARGFVDVLIPRGSAELIEAVVSSAKVPVIETGAGVVHIFLDESAQSSWAQEIVHNSKVQRPSVCNAVETLLVHAGAAQRLLPAVLGRLAASGVTVHGDARTRAIYPDAIAIDEHGWTLEHLSPDISVGIVDSLDEAIEHIGRYSTKHTESIVTSDLVNAERFLAEVDSAVVMVNTSTRFTDGAEFGFGAEVGISTQKLHARGPMGLTELTSTKWIVRGMGQVRG